MSAAIDHIKSAAPPLAATAVGWPWWAVAIILAVSYGPSCAMGWLDVADRVHCSPWRRKKAQLTLSRDEGGVRSAR